VNTGSGGGSSNDDDVVVIGVQLRRSTRLTTRKIKKEEEEPETRRSRLIQSRLRQGVPASYCESDEDESYNGIKNVVPKASVTANNRERKKPNLLHVPAIRGTQSQPVLPITPRSSSPRRSINSPYMDRVEEIQKFTSHDQKLKVLLQMNIDLIKEVRRFQAEARIAKTELNRSIVRMTATHQSLLEKWDASSMEDYERFKRMERIQDVIDSGMTVLNFNEPLVWVSDWSEPYCWAKQHEKLDYMKYRDGYKLPKPSEEYKKLKIGVLFTPPVRFVINNP
jgi:hypothetical protein